MTDDAVTGSEHADSERAELERLRAEVARLRARQDGRASPRRHRPRRRARVAAATALLTVSCLLAPLSVVSVWARGEVTDTDRYVATVAPLAGDPAIQRAVADRLTDTVLRYVDVEGLTRQALAALGERGTLPPALAGQLEALAVPVANGVRSFVRHQVERVVSGDAFARAWAAANRAAHERLVAVLRGGGTGAVAVRGDKVVLRLAGLLDVVKRRLVAAGFPLAGRIPAVDASFTILDSTAVRRAQRGFDLLDAVGFWLPLVLVALAAAGIRLMPDHRRAFLGAGAGVAAAMLVAGIALAAGRRAYLAGVPAGVLPPDAAAALYDGVVRFLREAVRAGFLAGVVCAAGAYLTGPARPAVAARRWLVAGFALARARLAAVGVLAGAGGWVAARARTLRILLVAVAFAVLLVWRYRTPALVGWLTAGVLAGLATIQFLASAP